MCSERHFRTPPVRIGTAPRSRTRTVQLGCVCSRYTKLGEPVVSCTPGVQLPDRSWMFTRRWSTMCSEWHFRTHPVRISTALQSRTETVDLGYVYTICTKLGSPVENCTTGVRLPDRSRVFIRPWQTICSESHFRTDPVRICTASRSRTPTTQLGYCIKPVSNWEVP